MTSAIIGLLLGGVFVWLCWWVGIARERSFYATLLMAIAFFYPAFAVGAPLPIFATATLVAAAFVAAAFYGYARRAVALPLALLGHALWDVAAAPIGVPGPGWWAGVCLGFDLMLAGSAAFAVCLSGARTNGWRAAR